MFYDVLGPKNTFLNYKNEQFKKLKNVHFVKRLTHAFGPKMASFPTFFLGNIGQENVFYDILEPKNTFFGLQKHKVQKVQN